MMNKSIRLWGEEYQPTRNLTRLPFIIHHSYFCI